MSRRNTEATIMNYFQQEPIEKAELMLKLVKDSVRKRKPVSKPVTVDSLEKAFQASSSLAEKKGA